MQTTVSLIVDLDLVGLIPYLCFCFLVDGNVALCEHFCFVKVCLTSLLTEGEEFGLTGEWRKTAKVTFVSGIVKKNLQSLLLRYYQDSYLSLFILDCVAVGVCQCHSEAEEPPPVLSSHCICRIVL